MPLLSAFIRPVCRWLDPFSRCSTSAPGGTSDWASTLGVRRLPRASRPLAPVVGFAFFVTWLELVLQGPAGRPVPGPHRLHRADPGADGAVRPRHMAMDMRSFTFWFAPAWHHSRSTVPGAARVNRRPSRGLLRAGLDATGSSSWRSVWARSSSTGCHRPSCASTCSGCRGSSRDRPARRFLGGSGAGGRLPVGGAGRDGRRLLPVAVGYLIAHYLPTC